MSNCDGLTIINEDKLRNLFLFPCDFNYSVRKLFEDNKMAIIRDLFEAEDARIWHDFNFDGYCVTCQMLHEKAYVWLVEVRIPDPMNKFRSWYIKEFDFSRGMISFNALVEEYNFACKNVENALSRGASGLETLNDIRARFSDYELYTG